MHRTSRRFWRSFDDLPDAVQEGATSSFELLKKDPTHPSLHFKKVGKFWSVRVGMSHRALAVQDGEDFIWVGSVPMMTMSVSLAREEKSAVDMQEMRPEYRREDFGVMVRGKYAAQMRESSNVVVLDPDVAEVFPNAKAVNDALRGLIELAKAGTHLPPESRESDSPTAPRV
jgi:hypothetical protein